MLVDGSENPKKWATEAIYFGDPSRSHELTEDVFRNTATSVQPLARVLIGSRTEVGQKHNRKVTRSGRKPDLGLSLKVTLTLVYSVLSLRFR